MKQPAGDLIDRHQQAVRFHQLVEDVLQNVLSILAVGHAPANEVAQTRLFALEHFGDALVLFDCLYSGLAAFFTHSCRRIRLCGYCRLE